MTLSVSEELEQLREENRQLRGVLGGIMRWPPDWGLSHTETIMLGSIVARDIVSHDALMTILYSDREDAPSPNIIYVFMGFLRKRLKPRGVKIRTVRGMGYYLPPEDRKMLREAAIK